MKRLLFLVVVTSLFFMSASGFSNRMSERAENAIKKIFKSTSLKNALKITEGQKDDSDEHKTLKAKLQYLLHLNNTWPLDKLKFMKQYLYLKRIHAIWTLPSLQDIRPLSLDKLFEEHRDDSYFLSALAFHNEDVEAKFNELKEKDAVNAEDIEFFTKAVRFRKQLRGMKGHVQTFYGGMNRFFSVAFSSNGKFIAASDNRKKISVWHIGNKNLSPVRSIQTSGGLIRSMQFLPKGESILALTDQGKVQEWVFKKPTSVKETSIPGISKSHWCAAVSASRKRYALVDTSYNSINIYEANDHGDIFHVRAMGGSGIHSIKSIALSDKGKHVAIGYGLGKVRVWSVDGSGFVLFHNFEGLATALAFSLDNRYLAVAWAGPKAVTNFYIRIVDLEKKKEIEAFSGHKKEITSLAFSPDGTYLASASEDATVRIWQVKEVINPNIRLLSLEMPSKLKKKRRK